MGAEVLEHPLVEDAPITALTRDSEPGTRVIFAQKIWMLEAKWVVDQHGTPETELLFQIPTMLMVRLRDPNNSANVMEGGLEYLW